MENRTFESLRDDIVAALGSLDLSYFSDESGVSLVDGFVSLPVTDNFKQVVISGRTLPTVAVVGNTTGRVYLIALKKLVPAIDLGGDINAD